MSDGEGLIPTQSIEYTATLVVLPLFLGRQFDEYIHVRLQKEILHQCLAVGYVLSIDTIGAPVVQVASLQQGNMVAMVPLTLTVAMPIKGDTWRVLVTQVDQRLGVCVSLQSTWPILITILDSEADEGELVHVTVQDFRILGKQNMIRVIATHQKKKGKLMEKTKANRRPRVSEKSDAAAACTRLDATAQ